MFPLIRRSVAPTADALSNFRKVTYLLPEGRPESKSEKLFREQCETTDSMNHRFWSSQNIRFQKEREHYIKTFLKNNEGKSPSSEEMANFYSAFAKRNYQLMASYNQQWHKNNWLQIRLAIRVFFSRIFGNKF